MLTLSIGDLSFWRDLGRVTTLGTIWQD